MDDLKNIVAHALEKKGVMAKIRAELRAHVFQAIEEQEGSSGLRGSSSGELNSQARRLALMTSTPQSSLLLELVREFLDFYELDYTASTMNAEAKLGATGSSSPTAHKDRASLATAARLQGGPSDERPLLLDLLLQAQGLSTASNIVPAASAHSSGIPRAGGLPTHSPSPSYELQQQREQPQSHAQSQPDSFDLDSPQSHPRSSGPSRRSGDGDHNASKSSISPPATAASSSGAPVSPSTPTTSGAQGPMSISLSSSNSAAQPAPVSPTTDANGNPSGPSGRRRRDRNLDMAAVRQEVHTTTATAPAANSTTGASAHSSASTKLSALPSLALNKSAPLPPVDVPLIELDPSSDLDASGELQQSQQHSRHPHQSRSQHAASSSFDGEESMDASGGGGGGLATSVELDQQRVAEIDRLLKSYQAQGVAPGPGQGLATNISSSTSSAQPSASQSRAGSAAQSRDNYDGINTTGAAAAKSRAQHSAAASGSVPDEDEYGDEEFAASDVGARSAEGDAIEESLEVDVDAPEEDSSLSPLKARGVDNRPTTAGSMQQDDSLDAEYFNSNSSLVEQSHGGARKQSSAPLGGRRAQIPPSIHSASHSSVDHEGSQSELDASASYEEPARGGGSKALPGASAADRDPLDVYSEDQSVNDPLEEQFDYTEEVEPVA